MGDAVMRAEGAAFAATVQFRRLVGWQIPRYARNAAEFWR